MGPAPFRRPGPARPERREVRGDEQSDGRGDGGGGDRDEPDRHQSDEHQGEHQPHEHQSHEQWSGEHRPDGSGPTREGDGAGRGEAVVLTAAVSIALTAAGVAVAGLRAYRRRFLSATRWFAVALLPLGLYLTGLFPVARTIGDEIADWATKLVLDPRVWTGIVLLAVSAGLLVTTRRLGRRGAVTGGSDSPPAAGPAPARPAVAPATGAPAAEPAPKRAREAARAEPAAPGRTGKAGKAGKVGKGGDGLDEFADIEEILRRRGI